VSDDFALADDFEFEPIPGLPSRPPAGEQVLWQGSPAWRSLAARAFHLRKVAVYFAVLVVVCAYTLLSGGGKSAGITAWSLLWLPLLGVAAGAVLSVFAWLSARSTIYTVTTRRVVIRYGIALPMTLNLPFKQLDSAGLHSHSDGTGDIAVKLVRGQRVAYLIMWPHVRPWRFTRAEPMLRSVPEAAHVAQILAQAIAPLEAVLVDRSVAGPATSKPPVRLPGRQPEVLA
jgi:hypothetical protein